jgi:hypothetical protein
MYGLARRTSSVRTAAVAAAFGLPKPGTSVYAEAERQGEASGMRLKLLGVAGLLALGACANIPFTRYLQPPPAPPPEVSPVGEPADELGTVLVPVVRQVRAERGDLGLIVWAEGVTATQGYWDAELRPVGPVPEGGTLTLELRVRPPLEPQAVGPERTRLVTAGMALGAREAASFGAVRVVGARNAGTAAMPR